jgi:hypothetical protein
MGGTLIVKFLLQIVPPFVDSQRGAVAPHCSSKSVRTNLLPMMLSRLLWTAAMLISPLNPKLESFFNDGSVLFTIGSTTSMLAINAAAAGALGAARGLKSSRIAGRE